mmetsp:Transcript_119688/g.383265  ORF Transcript_119688/g.383265 Transcript_119688/m.383265 type:complete len:110 (+) Transcript_119688:417-746(+)
MAEFPHLRRLLVAAMRALGRDGDLAESHLNVMCRLYSPGDGLPLHFDRKTMFCEDVYGCVLQNTSDRVLEFRLTARSTQQVLEQYFVEEVPRSMLPAVRRCAVQVAARR